MKIDGENIKDLSYEFNPKPLNDDELGLMRGLESPITLEDKERLIATVDELKIRLSLYREEGMPVGLSELIDCIPNDPDRVEELLEEVESLKKKLDASDIVKMEYWREGEELKEERNALSRKLNQSRLRREFLLEEENAGLKKRLNAFDEAGKELKEENTKLERELEIYQRRDDDYR